jgi:hypothetical protein
VTSAINENHLQIRDRSIEPSLPSLQPLRPVALPNARTPSIYRRHPGGDSRAIGTIEFRPALGDFVVRGEPIVIKAAGI